TATLALEHSNMVAGLVFLAPATHPWPGGATSWYYSLTAIPVLGRVFVETLAYAGAKFRIKAATDCVFAPNAAPASYVDDVSIELLLRPSAFRANALDVEGLF